MRTMSQQTAWEVLSFLAPNLQIPFFLRIRSRMGVVRIPKKWILRERSFILSVRVASLREPGILTEPEGFSGGFREPLRPA